MSERSIAIKVMMLPKDTNPLGTIFGGVILSQLDLAGGIEARKHSAKRFVTRAMREVEFVAPVFLGDVVTFFTSTERLGKTSVTVNIQVEAARFGPTGNREVVKVTEATVVYVAIDDNFQPTPITNA
jgi:acyl-CoA thioesterase YciA